ISITNKKIPISILPRYFFNQSGLILISNSLSDILNLIHYFKAGGFFGPAMRKVNRKFSVGSSTLAVLLHVFLYDVLRNPCKGITSVMVKVLHGNHAGIIRE